MKGGYAGLEWIRDEDGREYVCYLDDVHGDHELSEEEKAKCLNVNEIIGTERW